MIKRCHTHVFHFQVSAGVGCCSGVTSGDDDEQSVTYSDHLKDENGQPGRLLQRIVLPYSIAVELAENMMHHHYGDGESNDPLPR